MATYITEPSHTFGEYLLLPGYSSTKCIPDNVCLKTPLVRYQRGESPAISLNIPMTSAIMQSVSDDTMADFSCKRRWPCIYSRGQRAK